MTAPNVEQSAPVDPMAELESVFDEAATTLSEPAGTPAPAAPPAPSPEAAPEAPSEPGEPARDEKGRFTKRSETEPAPAAAPTDPASASAAPPAEPSPSPESPADDGGLDTTGYPAFEYASHGKQFSIPGSAVGEDGVFIPTEQVPNIQRLLAEAHHNRDFGRELGRAVAEAKRESETLKREYTLKMQRLHEVVKDPDRLMAFAENLERDWPLLEAEVKRELAEQRLQEMERQQQEMTRQAAEVELRPKMQMALEMQVDRFVQSPEMKGLFADADRQALLGRLREFERDIFSRDPETGEVMVDLDVIQRELGYAAHWRRQARQQEAQLQRVAQQNAATKAPAAPPPTVGTKQGPAPSASPKKTYKSREEADEDIWGKGFSEL